MKRSFTPVLAILLGLSPFPAAAGDFSFMRLLPGWQTEEGTQMIGVEILLNPGWKTYWRAPGAGGIPPHFDWAGSQNVAGAKIHWPRPEIQHAYGLTTLGYSDRVVFPVEILPQDPDAPVDINLALSYGVCEEVCIPAHSTDMLPASRQPNETATRSIESALASRPLDVTNAGITNISCTLTQIGEKPQLAAEITFAAAPIQTPYTVFETGSEVTFLSATSTNISENTLNIAARLDHYGNTEPELNLESLRLTLLDSYTAIDITGCPES